MVLVCHWPCLEEIEWVAHDLALGSMTERKETK